MPVVRCANWPSTNHKLCTPRDSGPEVSKNERLRSSRLFAAEDRKSTRLNSSHSSSSYAVFCLKKKKIDRRRGEGEFGPAAALPVRVEAVRSVIQRRSLAGGALERGDGVAVAAEGNGGDDRVL